MLCQWHGLQRELSGTLNRADAVWVAKRAGLQHKTHSWDVFVKAFRRSSRGNQAKREVDRAFKRLDDLEWTIAETPTECATGLAVKLCIWVRPSYADNEAADHAVESVYDTLVGRAYPGVLAVQS